MGILGFLTREKAEAPVSVEELEGRLGRLADERRRLAAGQTERARRRRELLTIDETDEEIAELERESAAAELQIERLDESEPLILAELAAARGRRREAQWEKIKASYFPAAANYLRAVRLALQEYETVVKIRDEGLGAGFSTEVNSIFAVPPWAIKADLINAFEREVERASTIGVPAIAAPKPPAKPIPPSSDTPQGYFDPVQRQFPAATPKAAPAGATPKAKPAHERIAKAKPAPVAQPKPFKAPQPDANGDVEIVLLRSGYETPAGHRPRMGERVSVPMVDGMRVVESGAAEFARAV